MYNGHHVKYPLSCQILKKLEFSWQIFKKTLKYKISRKSVQWELIPCGWRDSHEKANSRVLQFCTHA